MIFKTTIETPVGTLRLFATNAGLRYVAWPANTPPAEVEEAVDAPEHNILREACTQLDEYFRGLRTAFDLPLDPQGTAFQRDAWRYLSEIPFGKTRTYGEQATAIGRPKASRAVGAANGRNPLSIIVPCHRVIGANGSLTGFAGGLDIKRFLLNHEAEHGSGTGVGVAS